MVRDSPLHPGRPPPAAALGAQVGQEGFLEEVAGCTWVGGSGGTQAAAGERGVRWGVRRCPAREPLDPCPSPAVLTEDGQPCSFPFRYGGRMLHSCTSEGSAHRKWWVPGCSKACKHRPPASPPPSPPSLPLPPETFPSSALPTPQ